MERRSSTLEDLPPLELRAVRDLDLAEPPGEGRPAHVSAASGVARRGDFVYVIGDDLLFLAEFRLSDPAPGRLHRVLEPHPGDEDAKPDLEVLTVLPPLRGHPYGAVLGLGSGSKPGRDRGFVWALGPDGALRGEHAVLDLGPLYVRLGQDIDALNVEGACVIGERLWLLHRGDHSSVRNVVAELSLGDVAGTLAGDRTIDPGELTDLRAYDLGALDGVPLTFSDATPLGGEALVFTASAEGKGEGGDGPIRGSVVGTLDAEGRVRRLRTIDRRYKVEGVHATVDTGVLDFLFVCDQDDPRRPSPLLSAAMPIDAAIERDDA